MKKWKILLGLVTSFVIVQTTVFAANECKKDPIYDNSCPFDSTFYGKLRFEEKYGLNDEFYARGGTNQILDLKYQIKEQCDYNDSDIEVQKGSNFFYTTEDLRSRKGVLPEREKPYRIITSNDYEIRKLPPQRDDHNLLVKYTVKYNVNGGQEKTHVECKYYAITWCGDGIVDKPGKDDKWEAEICDPKDPNHVGRGEGGCDDTCKPVKKAVCSSNYNGKKIETLTEGNHLCTEGTYSDFYEDKINHKWTWKCKNKIGNGVDCSAIQPYCGDGNVDKGEQCDPKDPQKTNWGNGGCDEVSCTPIKVGDPVCNSKYNGQRLKDLKEGNHLCTEGTYSEFGYDNDLHKWTWRCKNKIGIGVDCSADKPYCGDGIPDDGEECDGSSDCSPECKRMYCGDGIRNNGEQCDYKDSTHAGRGPKGCNEFCEPEFDPDVSCTQTFKKTLRCGSKERFPDDFKAGGTDRWLYSFDVIFEPEKGYNINGGLKPTFGWTQTLKNANMLVKVGQEMRIIEAEEDYLIKNCPKKRSYENLYMEYLVVSAGENYAGKKLPNSKLSSHKECVYYEISWCGDGILDTKYGEECDPGSEGTSVLPDGRICNSDCKIKGELKMEKTLKSENKYVKEVGQELVWEVKATAKGGDVKDVNIKDYLPEVLTYESMTPKLPAGVTLKSKEPGKGKDSKGEYLLWETTGTLKQGESIVLEIKTKVNKMPKATDNYENVACAWAEGMDENCDKKPVETGKLKMEKTLKSENKYVKEVGQELVWEVKATAEGGDVKDVNIKDYLPEVLTYESMTPKLPAGVTLKSKEPGKGKDSKGEYLLWETTGTLKQGESIVFEIKTKVNKMPKTTDNYENVACAWAEGMDENCDKKPVETPTLWIKKYFLNSDGTTTKDTKTVKIGDEITYKIEFGNDGETSATITKIKDFLPKNVEYISGSIHIDRASTHSSSTQTKEEELWSGFKIVDGTHIEIYDGMTLEPGDKGYITIKVKVLEKDQKHRTNAACIYLNDKKIDCDFVTHEISVSCKPELSPATFGDVCTGETSTFSTTVTCKSQGGKADIQILCDGNVIKTGHVEQLTGSCSSNVNDTSHIVKCMINGSTQGEGGELCEGSFIRKTTSCGSPSGSCFVAGTKVLMADGTEKNIEDVIEGDYVMGESGPNKVKGYDQPLLGDRELYSINGSEPFVSYEHPFKTTDGWKAIEPTMAKLEIVNALNNGWLIPNDQTEDLRNITKLSVGDKLIKRNGTEKVVSLQTGAAKNGAYTQLYNFMLDGDNTYYANGYLVHNKGGGSSGGSGDPSCEGVESVSNGVKCTSKSYTAYFRLTCDGKKYYSFNYKNGDKKNRDYTFTQTECKNAKKVECAVSKNDSESGSWKTSSQCTRATAGDQECFNVNAGNFSIEEGEILPFYWNLFNMENWVKDNESNYTEIEGHSYKNAPELYEARPSCEADDAGKIAMNSMVCTFNIYHGKSGGKTPLYTVEGPCLTEKNSKPLKEGLLQYWYDAMYNTYCKGSNSKKCYFSYSDKRDPKNSSLLNSAVYYIENFGSGASLSLNGKKREGSWGLSYNSNSEKTKPYGEYQIRLESVKYLQCDGSNWQQMDAGKEAGFTPCESNFVLTNPYTVQKTPSGNLTASTKNLHNYLNLSGTTAFDSYINAIPTTTYNKNSKVESAMDNFIKKYEKLAVKVDTKAFGNNKAIVKKVPGKDIYFIDGNVTFKQSKDTINKAFTIVQANSNQTVTINGNLEYNMMLLTKGNIKFNGNCTDGQTVKGIFYAGGNLIRGGINKNKNINNNFWCTNGSLYVKGVLIGDGFDNLMGASRSHLNDWFNTNNKKGSIMNGASVVIEYSPSVFTKGTMPPGAEDFTTALSIYKN